MYSRLIVFAVLVFGVHCYDDWVYKTIRDAEAKNEAVDECGICTKLTESFAKLIEKTSLNEGIENYEDSEMRLTEIQENVCLDVEYVKNKCLRLAADQEDLIEYWWLNKRKNEDLFSWLCIRKLSLCCLPGLVGPNCDQKCPGYPDNICGLAGECEGSGSRKGSGVCLCNKGYDGDLCEKCSQNYTMVNGICEECDRACGNGCFKLGKEGCNEGCAVGYREDENKLCRDVNECEENPSICSSGEVCQNVEGGFHCIPCNKACKTCLGFGPKECLECADGYVKEGRSCVPFEESQASNRLEVFKYLLYVALTVLSCWLMNRRPLVGSFITVLLCVYIALREYANHLALDSTLEVFEEFL